MNQITKSFLEAQVLRLNRATGSPETPYTRTGVRHTANIGNYHLDGAYGGYALHRMENQSGWISDVFRCGHVSKRSLSDRISAFIDGVESVQRVEEQVAA